MKSKFLFLLAIFYQIHYFGQEKVDIGVSYKLTYKLDSTSNNLQNENFVLYANKDKSKFVSASVYMKDSLSQKPNVELRSISLKYSTPNNYYIITELKTNTIKHFQTFLSSKIYYRISDKINWSIQKETKTIQNLKCQKATTELYGRKWIAWFTEDYPFPIGPYKFYGLPGLIIEVYDSENDYHFVANQIKAKKNKLVDFDIEKKFVETTKDKFWNTAVTSQTQLDPIFNDLVFEDKNVVPTMKKNKEEQAKRKNNPLELKH